MEKPLNSWQHCQQVNMSPRLKVSDFVLQRLKNLEEDSFGYVLGITNDDLTYALGITKQLNSTDDKNDNLNSFDIIPNLPAGINLCGVFFVSKEGKIENNIIHDLCKKIEETPVVVIFDVSSKEFTCSVYEHGGTKKIGYEAIQEKDLANLFVYLRLTATIPLSCDLQSEALQEAFDCIEEKIIHGSAAFHILDTEIYVLGEKSIDINGISSEATVEKLYSTIKKKEGAVKVINVGLFLKGTDSDKSPQLAPLIKYVKKMYQHAAIQLSLDSLAITPNQLKLSQLHPVLVKSALRSLSLNKKILLSQLNSEENQSSTLPKTHHFFPPSCGHFVSIIYPTNLTSEQLKETRETFHLLLSLPTDRPLFRRGNAFDFSPAEENHSSNMILNPHEGLPSSGIPDGEPCLVQGTYAYHHYMQDKLDDSGWGCAYRSLQTIFSWFRFQGYTNRAVPTHKEIQQCLVNIGDKPSSFVGSKQWIGSTEVSFVLDTMLGITCRIVNVSSGEEMSMKGGELSYHFKTQGTPVMIGGGVLAHTILGVDYNKKTGAIKFLILDPHYTGEENLKTIQTKGWCGWKGPEFWKKDAFYNMCLPLRPKCV